MQEIETSSEKVQRIIERKIYTLEDGLQVAVSAEKFPPEKMTKPGQVVIFLPGWAVGEGSLSTTEITQELANAARADAYRIITRADQVVPDSLLCEAEAIRRFIEEKKLKEVILVGYSQGGDKAIDAAVLMQKLNPNIKVSVVLLDSVGLYEQGFLELVANFTRDSMIDTTVTMNKNLLKHPSVYIKGLKAGTDIVMGIGKETARSGFGYANRFINEVREMAGQNPRNKELKAPVVLIFGATDRVSSHQRVAPIEKQPTKNLQVLIKNRKARETMLRKIFPNASSVSVLVAEKLGHHGLPLFRSKSVARVATHLLP